MSLQQTCDIRHTKDEALILHILLTMIYEITLEEAIGSFSMMMSMILITGLIKCFINCAGYLLVLDGKLISYMAWFQSGCTFS